MNSSFHDIIVWTNVALSHNPTKIMYIFFSFCTLISTAQAHTYPEPISLAERAGLYIGRRRRSCTSYRIKCISSGHGVDIYVFCTKSTALCWHVGKHCWNRFLNYKEENNFRFMCVKCLSRRCKLIFLSWSSEDRLLKVNLFTVICLGKGLGVCCVMLEASLMSKIKIYGCYGYLLSGINLTWICCSCWFCFIIPKGYGNLCKCLHIHSIW